MTNILHKLYIISILTFLFSSIHAQSVIDELDNDVNSSKSYSVKTEPSSLADSISDKSTNSTSQLEQNASKLNSNAIYRVESGTVVATPTLNKISFDNLYVYLFWEDGTKDEILVENVYKIIFDLTASFSATNTSGGIQIYPNPASELIYITSDENRNNMEISIYNINGQRMLSKSSGSMSETVNISTLPTGVYFVKVNNHIFKLNKL